MSQQSLKCLNGSQSMTNGSNDNKNKNSKKKKKRTKLKTAKMILKI